MIQEEAELVAQETDVESLRKQIDDQDKLLLDALARRFSLVAEMAELKRRKEMPMYDPVREYELVSGRIAWGEARNIDNSLVNNLFRLILTHSGKLQRKMFTAEDFGRSEPDIRFQRAETGYLQEAESAASADEIGAEDSEKRGYHLVSRDSQRADTVISVGDVNFGGESFVVIAGPCSVESEEQIQECAKQVKLYGGSILRGGAFKPRTSPYSFQGLGFDGLRMLADAARENGLLSVSEVMNPADVGRVAEEVDILQIGARSMQNYPLLREVGLTDSPVLLKRGLAATIDELLCAAEYVLMGGNQQVILCERGIRTFGSHVRFTLDLAAVPILRERTYLPVIVDPSHAAGDYRYVVPLALAARAVGCHGVMVEVHPNRAAALSDRSQALSVGQYARLMELLESPGRAEEA